ncbi:MAG: hypothetical protein ACT4TC_26115 [Myxococcaceae bacterium]
MVRPLLLLVLLSIPAFAQNALSMADKAFDSLEFDRAAALFKQALGQPGSRAERIRAYKGLGLSQAFMGETKNAKTSFERLLLLDPTATVDVALGPKITGPFQAALKGGKHAGIAYNRNPSSGDLVVKLKEDIPLANELQVYVRADGLDRYTVISGPSSSPLEVSTEPNGVTDVYMQAVDANEGVLYEEGSAQKPIRFGHKKKPSRTTPQPEVAFADPPTTSPGALDLNQQEPAVTKSDSSTRWPLWVGIGVAVAAGVGVGTYFIVKKTQPRLPDADSDITLPGVAF